MIRLLLRALLAGVLAAVLLVQLSQTEELLAWELLLAALLIWLLRDIPGRAGGVGTPLFDIEPEERPRLPRVVSTSELAVVDAMSGYVSPDRRLRPMLRRLSSHRLARFGLSIDSRDAVDRLGEENWVWLVGSDDEPVGVEELERIVSRLEEL